MNNNYEKRNVNSENDCNRYDIYNLKFTQNLDDDFSNSVKSNGTGLSVDLNNYNIGTVNSLDD